MGDALWIVGLFTYVFGWFALWNRAAEAVQARDKSAKPPIGLTAFALYGWILPIAVWAVLTS